MTCKIVGGHGQAKESDVKALEKEIGGRFPEDYRAFIIRNNGGTPIPNVFGFYDKARSMEDESGVDRFLSIGINEYFSVERHLTVYSDRIPDDFIPVARDSGGGLVLVKLKGGGVYFWDHEFEADDGEQASEYNVYPVSGSFDDFLSSLHDIEE